MRCEEKADFCSSFLSATHGALRFPLACTRYSNTSSRSLHEWTAERKNGSHDDKKIASMTCPRDEKGNARVSFHSLCATVKGRRDTEGSWWHAFTRIPVSFLRLHALSAAAHMHPQTHVHMHMHSVCDNTTKMCKETTTKRVWLLRLQNNPFFIVILHAFYMSHQTRTAAAVGEEEEERRRDEERQGKTERKTSVEARKRG